MFPRHLVRLGALPLVIAAANANAQRAPAGAAELMNRAFDAQLGAAAENWSARFHDRAETARLRARDAQRKAEAARVLNTTPSLPLERYAGVYADSMLGDVVVRDSSGILVLTFGLSFHGTLQHWDFDTFRTRFNTPLLGAVPVQFRLGPMGTVEELQMDLAGPTTFKRRPERTAAIAP